MTIVYFSAAKGRPPGARRNQGNTYTWAAWWTGDPREDGELKPDAYGGVRDKMFAAGAAMAHATPFVARVQLKPLSMRYCQRWRDALRGKPLRPWPAPPPRPETGTPEYQRLLEELYRKAFEADSARVRLLNMFQPGWVDLAVFGLRQGATEADVRREFRRLALKHHPDRGGSEAEFKVLNGHYQAALRAVGA